MKISLFAISLFLTGCLAIKNINPIWDKSYLDNTIIGNWTLVNKTKSSRSMNTVYNFKKETSSSEALKTETSYTLQSNEMFKKDKPVEVISKSYKYKDNTYLIMRVNNSEKSGYLISYKVEKENFITKELHLKSIYEAISTNKLKGKLPTSESSDNRFPYNPPYIFELNSKSIESIDKIFSDPKNTFTLIYTRNIK